MNNSFAAALRDESERVRARAADALARLVRQPTAKIPVDLPEQLVTSLSLPGLDEWSLYTGSRPRDSLFDALAAVAPGPSLTINRQAF